MTQQPHPSAIVSTEDIEGTADDYVIGGEESHGVLVTPKIRDKDTGGAVLLMAELALDCKRQGSNVIAYLKSKM